MDDGRDRTLSVLRRGYEALPALRARHDGAGVRIRLFGEPALLLGGPQGVRLFYDRSRLTRVGAVPAVVRKELFGDGAVQTLDDEEHLTRKSLLMSAVTPESVRMLAGEALELWREAVDRWIGAPRVVLFDEAVRVIGVAAFRWAGLPLAPSRTPGRVRQLLQIVDGFGTDPIAHARGAVAHARAARWAQGVVEDVRRGAVWPRRGSPLQILAAAPQVDGSPLPARAAGLDLLNLVRPTIAVAWHVTYAAMALHEHPQWRARLAQSARPADTAEIEAFAHEVRRFYPFTPALAARARRPFTWNGEDVPAGRLVVLDVHGTNHDPAYWQHADRFYPHRFTGTTAAGLPAGEHDPDAFVPNGGGDVYAGHRCAGEGIMTALLSDAVRVLVSVSYSSPRQDLRVGTRRIPPRPGDGFVMTDVAWLPSEGPRSG